MLFSHIMKGVTMLLALTTAFASPTHLRSNDDFVINYENEPIFQQMIKEQPVNYDALKTIQQQNYEMKQKQENGQTVCNILEFSGIGPWGSLSVGLGSKLRQQGFLNKTYDITVGTSGASINAMISGKIQNIDKAFYVMRGFWSSLKDKYVYINESQYFEQNWGSLNNAPLQQTIGNLDKLTGPTYYRDVIVTVTNLQHSNYDNNYNLKYNSNQEHQIIAASMNLPFYFQKMLLNGEYVVDGSFYSFSSVTDIIGVKQCDYYNYDIIGYAMQNKKIAIYNINEYIESFAKLFSRLLINTDRMQNSCNSPIGTVNIYNLFPSSFVHHNQFNKITDYSNTTAVIIDGLTSNYTLETFDLC